jgi:hypothetical protein
VNIETITAHKTLSPTEKKYQFISAANDYNINLPNAGFSEGDRFYICNYNAYTSSYHIRVQFDSVTKTALYAGSSVYCVYNGSAWLFENIDNKNYSNISVGQNAKGTTIGIGIGQDASANNRSIAIGNLSAADGYSVAIGKSASAGSGTTAGQIAVGTESNTNNKPYSIALGNYAKCERYGELVVSAGSPANPCKHFRNQVSWYGTTLNSTQTELYLGGVSANRCTILSNSAVLFKIDVIAQKSDGAQAAGYIIDGVIKNDGGTTSFTGTPTIRIIGEDDPAWSAIVEADDTNDALVVKVTGVAGTTISWHVAGYFTEVRL